ncbi:MAG: hypothetical protein GX028_08515 [Clostridiaceae bacterium]|nr:hypothetical protein [Clostridiaceae bacterium]
MSRSHDKRPMNNNSNRQNRYMISRKKSRKLNIAGFMIMVTILLVVATGILYIGNHLNLFDNSPSASAETTGTTTAITDNTSDSSTKESEPPETETEPTQPPTPTPVPDTEPPVISGTDDITVFVGDTVSYRKNVQVEDNIDESPTLDIDSSQVNMNAPGIYPVKYFATDAAGNTSEVMINITILERTESEYSLDEMLEEAEIILSEILEPGMTQLEQAEAIYWWTKSHIVYVNHSDKTDWLQGAWQGINKGSGDCFNYFATAKLLLIQAGIDNVDVIKSTGSHFWSLVNVGDGYYHFDTTPRKAGGEFFMLTDQEITAYSDQHGDSHIWDRDKYPQTPQE